MDQGKRPATPQCSSVRPTMQKSFEMLPMRRPAMGWDWPKRKPDGTERHMRRLLSEKVQQLVADNHIGAFLYFVPLG